MEISCDPNKNDWNIRERDLPFARAAELEWATAEIAEDTRKVYPEARLVALGLLDGRVHVLCFTPTADGIRVISFRKANAREVRRYEQAHATD